MMAEQHGTHLGPRVPGRRTAEHIALAICCHAALCAGGDSADCFDLSTLLADDAPRTAIPKGLTVVAYVNRLTGDVQEIDGAQPLHRYASAERSSKL